MNKRKLRQTLTGYAFLAPALIIFITLVALPIILSLGLAFTKWNFFSGLDGLKFVGLRNFEKLFTTDRNFKTALMNTIIYAVTTVPITIFFALILAHVLNGEVNRGHNGRNHDALNSLYIQLVIAEQIGHNDTVLVGGHRRLCHTAPALEQVFSIKNGRLDIRVADIHHKNHDASSFVRRISCTHFLL